MKATTEKATEGTNNTRGQTEKLTGMSLQKLDWFDANDVRDFGSAAEIRASENKLEKIIDVAQRKLGELKSSQYAVAKAVGEAYAAQFASDDGGV